VTQPLAQTITLVFTDGRRISAVVPAFCATDDKLGITDVLISEPAPLPEGCYWEQTATEMPVPMKGEGTP